VPGTGQEPGQLDRWGVEDRQVGDHRPTLTPRILLGLFLVVVGGLYTLDNLGVVDARQVLRYWPVLLILVGVLKLQNVHRRGSGYLWICIGVWFLLDRLDVVHFRFRDIWPAFLVIAGGYLIIRGLWPRSRGNEPAQVSSSTVDAFAFMSGTERVNNSQDFRGGELVAFMGGCEIDLRQAAIRENEAVIDVFAMMGGVELKVPQDWSVTSTVFPLMGACVDKTRPKGPPTQRLVVKGLVIMGGIEIHH
jgi:predicted membrane protein